MSVEDVDQAFYRLTVAQRDQAWREQERLKAELRRLRAERAELARLWAEAVKLGLKVRLSPELTSDPLVAVASLARLDRLLREDPCPTS